MYYLYYKWNDGTDSTWSTEQSGEHGTAATTFTFYVNTAKLTRSGYDHIGWADDANATTADYHGGEPITLTKNNLTKTIYAVWKENQHEHHDDNDDGFCDVDHTCMHEKDSEGYCTVSGCNHPDTCCPKPPVDPPVDPTNTTVNVYVKPVDSKGNDIDLAQFKSHDFGTKIEKSRYFVGSLTTTEPLSNMTESDSGFDQLVTKFAYQQMAQGTDNWSPATGVDKNFEWARQIRFTELKKQADDSYDLYGQIIAYKLTLDPTGGTMKNDPSGYYLSGTEVTFPTPSRAGFEFVKWQEKNGSSTGGGEDGGDTDMGGGWTPPKYAPRRNSTGAALTKEIDDDQEWEAVWKDITPSDDNIDPNLEIYVECTTNTTAHGRKTYNLIANSYTAGTITMDANGNQFCELMVKTADYITEYNKTTNVTHTAAKNVIAIPMMWDTQDSTWRVYKENGAEPNVIKATCKPSKPALNEGSPVLVQCVQDGVHTDSVKDSAKKPFALGGFAYRYEEVTKEGSNVWKDEADGKWTYQLKLKRDEFVKDYNKRSLVTTHTDTNPNEVTYVTWKHNGTKWNLVTVSGYPGFGAVINVTCKPKAPTADELKKLEMAVQVKCVVDDSQEHTEAYGLLGECNEDYFVGEPRKDGDDWLCDISYDPDPYVAEFNKAFPNLKHVQNDEKIVPVTLIWAEDSWQIKTQGRVHVTEEYTVTFDSYGGSKVDPQVVEYGLYAKKPADPTRKGYTFAFWYLGKDEQTATVYDFNTPVTENITLTAKWEINKFKVTFDTDGGEPIPGDQFVEWGLFVEEPTTKPTKTGYTFDGWYLGDEKYDFSAAVEQNITLTANWTQNTYTVTFDPNGGSVDPTSKTVTFDEPYGEMPVPTRTGYDFLGWFTAAEGGDQVTANTTVTATTDHTLYAQWEAKKANVHLMIFKSGDLSKPIVDVPYTTDKLAGETLDLTALDPKTYLTFDFEIDGGWYDDGLFNLYKKYVNGEQANKPVALTELQINGNWQNLKLIVTELVPVVYFDSLESLTAYQNDHSKTEGILRTTKARVGSALPTADAPTATREGYTFTFWSREGQTVDVTDQTVNGWTNLYANWEANSYTVTFDANGGETANPASKEVTFDAAYGELAATSREGYTFDGWFTQAEGGTEVTKETTVTTADNHTLYAHWTANKYTVTFDANGGTAADPASKEVTFDAAYGELAATSREGYTFDGWFTQAEGGTEVTKETTVTTADNHTLYAHWTANKYTVTFDANGGTAADPASKEVTFDAAYGELATTSREGYTFDGWFTEKVGGTKVESATVVTTANNHTLYAHWTANKYTVTFNANGGETANPENKEVTFDAAYGELAATSRKGYTFAGWFTQAEGGTEVKAETIVKTAGNHTLYAHWTPNTYNYEIHYYVQQPDGSYVEDASALDTTKSGTFDSTVTVTPDANKYGAHFSVNNTKSKLSGVVTVNTPAEILKLEVYYDRDFHTLTYLDSRNGSVIGTSTVRCGVSVAAPKDPTKAGYWFDGWYNAADNKKVTFPVTLTNNMTVYAGWTMIVIPSTIAKKTPKLNTADHFAYVQGYPDGTVKPAGNITRAETAAILFRLMDDTSRNNYYSTKSGFRDVAAGSWYNTYVATLNNAGVITDSANGYFRPNDAITRAELAAMLAAFTDTTRAANYFNDVTANYWAANAIAICAKLGWITGYPDGSFRPDKNVTRAELMAMINRATGRAPKSADAFLPGMKTWSDNTADKWYYLDVQEATNSHSYSVRPTEIWTAITAAPNWSKYE